jgi:hypothetical protein
VVAVASQLVAATRVVAHLFGVAAVAAEKPTAHQMVELLYLVVRVAQKV